MSCHGLRAAKHERGIRPQHASVDPEFDFGSEDRHQRLEVTIARGREERIDDLSLAHEIIVWLGKS